MPTRIPMVPWSQRHLAILTAIGVVSGTATAAVNAWAAFTSTTDNVGSSLAAAPDWVAPALQSSVVQKAEGGLTGFIRQGGTYRVYADLTDSGNPASGTSAVTANLTALTTGASAAALTSGAWSADGTAYGWRSSILASDIPLASGVKTWTLTAADAAGNGSTSAAATVTVDNIAPSGADVQTVNVSGGTVGQPESGDRITFSFSEQIDPHAVQSGWSGSAAAVTVRFVDNGLNDRVEIYNGANTAQLPLGTITTNQQFVTADRAFTTSTMAQSNTTVTITLGTPSGATIATNVGGIMSWSPSAALFDRAGNPMPGAAVPEVFTPGGKDF
ncbi:hypothetical protein LRS13_13600 [Svornostia abyssi]|uniref:Bacterial Ig-like domain-containing protein n=1 Tax=Svornostia abyssi TaxID=2898438 RepID=A0ABY5PAQ2_9ACTN|nr:hypothetical protein LRS13_13600 [Parviterribacteraceae bacterium J379]